MQVAPKLSAGMTSMQHLRTSTTVPAHGGAERNQPWGGAAAPRPQGLRGLGGELRVLPLRRERSRGLRHRHVASLSRARSSSAWSRAVAASACASASACLRAATSFAALASSRSRIALSLASTSRCCGGGGR